MKKTNKGNIVTALFCALALSVTSFFSGYAASGASGITYNSQGKIIFNNNTSDTSDDVVFDSSDFTKIDNMVTTGKTNVRDELNKYDTVSLTGIPTFTSLASSVANISSGTNAAASEILSGKKVLVGKRLITGSMKNNGALNSTINPGGSYNIPAGYTSGGTISASQCSHNIQSSKTETITSTSGSISPSAGYNAMGSVSYSVSGVDASKIVSGQSILGVNGTATGESHTVQSSKSISPDFSSGNYTVSPDSGYNVMSGVTINKDSNLIAENIKDGVEIFGVTGSLNSSPSTVEGGSNSEYYLAAYGSGNTTNNCTVSGVAYLVVYCKNVSSISCETLSLNGTMSNKTIGYRSVSDFSTDPTNLGGYITTNLKKDDTVTLNGSFNGYYCIRLLIDNTSGDGLAHTLRCSVKITIN